MFDAMNDDEVEAATENAIRGETKATTNVVRHFVEIHRREIYLRKGYSTVFAYAIEKYGLAKSSVSRRTAAMELAMPVPEALDFIDQGRLYLQSAADIQKFLNYERGLRKKYSNDQKKALVESLLDLTTREVEERLVQKNPNVSFKDSKKLVAPRKYKITYLSNAATEEKFERIRDLRSTAMPYANRDDLMNHVTEVVLDKIDPARKAARHHARTERSKRRSAESSAPEVDLVSADKPGGQVAPDQQLVSAEEPGQQVAPFISRKTCQHSQFVPAPELAPEDLAPDEVFEEEVVSEAGEIQLVATFGCSKPEVGQRSRSISAEERRTVRTEEGCVYESGQPFRKCGSARVQMDHVVPFSEGGPNTAANLQPLCARHNRFRYRESLSVQR